MVDARNAFKLGDRGSYGFTLMIEGGAVDQIANHQRQQDLGLGEPEAVDDLLGKRQ